MLSHSKFTLAIAPYHTVNTESSSVPAWQWQSVHIADRRASCCQLRTLNLSSSRLWSNRWVCLTSVRLCARSHLKFTSTVFQDSTTAPAWPAWTSPPSKVQLCTHCFCTLAHVHVRCCWLFMQHCLVILLDHVQYWNELLFWTLHSDTRSLSSQACAHFCVITKANSPDRPGPHRLPGYRGQPQTVAAPGWERGLLTHSSSFMHAVLICNNNIQTF